MRKGFIDQTDFRHPLQWYPADREIGFFKSTKQDIKLTATFKSGTIIAHYCSDCKKFVIDENELER